jgi:hypothetical protein
VSVVTTGGDIFINSERSLPAMDADNSSINRPSPNIGLNIKIFANSKEKIVNKMDMY